MLPDPAFYTQCLQDAFDELQLAAIGARPSTPTVKASPEAGTTA
jgi:hypothetical protein